MRTVSPLHLQMMCQEKQRMQRRVRMLAIVLCKILNLSVARALIKKVWWQPKMSLGKMNKLIKRVNKTIMIIK